MYLIAHLYDERVSEQQSRGIELRTAIAAVKRQGTSMAIDVAMKRLGHRSSIASRNERKTILGFETLDPYDDRVLP